MSFLIAGLIVGYFVGKWWTEFRVWFDVEKKLKKAGIKVVVK